MKLFNVIFDTSDGYSLEGAVVAKTLAEACERASEVKRINNKTVARITEIRAVETEVFVAE